MTHMSFRKKLNRNIPINSHQDDKENDDDIFFLFWKGFLLENIFLRNDEFILKKIEWLIRNFPIHLEVFVFLMRRLVMILVVFLISLIQTLLS